LYTVEFENIAVTASQDLFSITAADDKPIEIVGMMFSQSTDLGDAAEEILRIQVIRGHATVGSGGAAVTPRPTKPNDAAAGFTCRRNDTTPASAGTAVNLFSDYMNIRTGMVHWFPDECALATDQTAALLAVRLLAAPTDSLNMAGTLFVREG
jgi:hypothetical protein